MIYNKYIFFILMLLLLVRWKMYISGFVACF